MRLACSARLQRFSVPTRLARHLGTSPKSPAIDAGRYMRALFTDVALKVGSRLAGAGLTGPFGIDAFTVACEGGTPWLVPLVEINPRLTFAAVAWALSLRLGRSRFRIGPTPPPDAIVLLASTPADPIAAWLY